MRGYEKSNLFFVLRYYDTRCWILRFGFREGLVSVVGGFLPQAWWCWHLKRFIDVFYCLIISLAMVHVIRFQEILFFP